jgi:thioesterase domain-containing protein
MVPSTIVILPELPMNPNGKIDTHALPAPGVVKAAPGESLPPTATESTISELWKQVLGLSAVGLDDDFFAIGGHSLLGMKLFSGIQRIFGVSLPLGKLFRAPTVRQLARLVDADLATKKAVEASSKMIASSHLHPIWEASAPPIPARPTTALVPIQPKGDAHPVFAIHGGDGGILFYGKLSQRLGDDLPFFAFEAPALTAGAQIPEESVEQTAAKYLEELLKVQPRGPFNLCGYSFGGVVAYEIACRLAARGETIAFLGLIDTDNPAAAIRRRSLSERVALSWNDQAQSKSGVLAKVSALSRRVGTGIVDRLCTEAEEALARSLPAAEKIARLRQVQLRKAHERAVEAYIPPRFPGKLTLFRAAIEGDKYEMARDYGWTDLVAELEIITVPGTHLSIFHEENIAGMADAFRDCMSAVTV